MRSSRSALLFLSNLSLSKFSALILCILISSILSFAAAPDRITSPIVSGQLIKLSAGVPLKAQPQYDQGRVDPSLRLGYMTLLTVPSASQQRALNKLLADQQDPHSPQYHKWLTPEQYADRFGLSPNDIQKLSTWLQSQGFAIVRVARGRNFIVFSGTAAQAESVFQTEIHNFNIDGEKHFANTTPISIPAALSGVVAGIRGLSNFHPISQALHAKPKYTKPDYTTSSGSLYVAPGDIATIYDILPLYTAGFNGTGQTLAVVGQTDVYLADLLNFRSYFGLSTAISACTTNSSNIITACDIPNSFQYVLINADPGTPSLGDLAEADLDLEWSGAVARNAQIIYVNAPDPSGNGVYDSMYYTIDNDLAPVMTMSYSLGSSLYPSCELGEAQTGDVAADETELAFANTEGITFLNSSGDSGAAECDYKTYYPVNGYAVSYPASSPSVTGVGGTMIPYTNYTDTYFSAKNGGTGGSALQYVPEQGWNDEQEWSEYCTAFDTTDPTCINNPGLDNWATAQETYIGVYSSGGGLSNCITETGSICATPPNGGFPQPTWQAGLAVPGETTAAVRFSPDVSLLASAYWPGFIICTPVEVLSTTSPYDTETTSSCANGIADSVAGVVVDGKYIVDPSIYGGTSVASPMFAGMVTLLNQYLVRSSTPGLGNINPTLYSLAATPANGVFHSAVAASPSLTVGSNGAFCNPGTPANQPAALQCPSSGANAGFLGFDASNFDPTTGYNLVTGLGSVDAYNLAVAWAASRGASTISVQAAPALIILSQTVTLTATMSPLSATGVVSFQYDVGDTATSIGQATLSDGVATLSTSILPIGIDNIVAFYSGDGYNMSSNSSATPVAVNVVAPDFTLTPTSSSGPVLAGQSAIYQFTIAPLVTSTFTSTVIFSCSGLPDATTTCNVNPPQIAAGTAGSPPIPVTLTVTTSGPNTSGGSNLRRSGEKRPPLLPLALPLAGIVMVGLVGRRVSKHAAIAGLCVLLALLGILLACGTTGKGPLPVTVTVNQGLPSSLFPNNTADGWPAQTAQFTATVTNGKSQVVNWLVTTANGGTIDANGVYTAPTVAAGLPMSVTITATSQSNPNQSGSAQEALNAATIPGTYPNIMLIANEGGAAGTTHSESVTLTVK
ncbi:MAG: protease pro-enzyme activation domain-containing protein [Terriglobales bacterium]|jgi:subtilase family serine protease